MYVREHVMLPLQSRSYGLLASAGTVVLGITGPHYTTADVFILRPARSWLLQLLGTDGTGT